MRIKRFYVQAVVPGDFLRLEPERARKFAREFLDEQASMPLRGPRGGWYEPIGPAYDYRDSAEPRFIYDEHTFVAHVDAKYVRPRHST